MDHNWYYDLTDDHRHSQDRESLLVWLCNDCALKLRHEVQFAGGDRYLDIPCWKCQDKETAK